MPRHPRPSSPVIPDRLAKHAGNENFPVATLFLERAHREPVLAFYRFVRLADDIADAPDVDGATKLQRLDALERALIEADDAHPEAAALAAADRRAAAGKAQALVMLDAFRRDAVQARWPDWAALVEYCELSAVPVGTFLIRLHGEGRETHRPARALCIALQLLNHLQDLEPDRRLLDRVYLPVGWMDAVGGEMAFFAPAAASLRRPVLDAALDRIDALIAEAERLPAVTASRRLAGQAMATLSCARLLSARLRAGDPVGQRIALGKADVARAVLGATFELARGRRGQPDHRIAAVTVRQARSSFGRGIAALGGERRRAMNALYAFCRTVDDLADAAVPPGERAAALELWAVELANLALDRELVTPIGRELAWARRRFALPAPELDLLLDRMLCDARASVRLADDAALEAYARGVAGSVGLLSVRIFGAGDADGFAVMLGHTLQLINILRDVREDAAKDRVYIPLARLNAGGIADGPATAIIGHPRFAQVWEDLAIEAKRALEAAERELAGLDPRPLRPARLMLWSYRPLLAKLLRQGWRPDAPRLRLGTGDRLRLALAALRPA